MAQWQCFEHWAGALRCYYLFDYYPFNRYKKEELSETDHRNRLEILHFKYNIHDLPADKAYMIRYKKQSIQNLATELQTFPFPEKSVIIPGPTSLSNTDSGYDNRMQLLLEKADSNIPPHKEYLLTAQSHKANHETKERGIQSDYFTIDAAIDLSGYSTAFILDDIYTQGSHFDIWSKMIMSHYTNLSVCGIFFGKTIFGQH